MMGYENKFYVVRKTIQYDSTIEKYFGIKIAEYDIGKCYPISDYIKDHYQKTDVYIFADDGETPIVVDKYDDPLLEIPVKDLIDIFNEKTVDGFYQFYYPFVELLKGFDSINDKSIVVLHYGH